MCVRFGVKCLGYRNEWNVVYIFKFIEWWGKNVLLVVFKIMWYIKRWSERVFRDFKGGLLKFVWGVLVGFLEVLFEFF